MYASDVVLFATEFVVFGGGNRTSVASLDPCVVSLCALVQQGILTMSDYGIVTTTANTPELAQKIATALVDAELAACVQTMPIVSTYRWQGKVETAQEFQVTIKTMSNLFDLVERKIREVHTYDTPEIVTSEIGGSTDYLAWIQNSVQRTSDVTPHHKP